MLKILIEGASIKRGLAFLVEITNWEVVIA